MKITQHDIDLFAREPELPGLSAVLDPREMGTRIAERLGLSRIEVRPNYVRLKPGVNCLVGYSFEADAIPQMGYAKVFTPADRPKLRKGFKKSLGRSQAGDQQSLLLDDLETVLHFFPYDAQLEALSHLRAWKTDRSVLPRMFEDDRDLAGATLFPIRYKPERRFVARLQTASGEAFAIKFLSSDDFRRAKTAAKQVVRRSGVRAATIAGNSDRYNVLAFEWLNGCVLTQYLRSIGYTPEVFDSLGGMLAQFHESRVRKLHHRTIESVLAALAASVDSAVHVMPELWPEAVTILDRLSKELGERWKSAQVPIHGDFYADQVLVTDHDVAILDFDSAVFGQLESDAGNLLAHLICDVLRGAIPGDSVANVRSQLIRTYSEHELPMDERLLDLLVSASLIQLLPQPFRSRTENWPEITRKILTYAGDLARGAQFGPELVEAFSSPSAQRKQGSGTTLEAAVDDNSMLAAATDADKMDGFLKKVLWGLGHASDERLVVSSNVMKHNPGRRCLIAYRLADGQTVLGKFRAKGLDRRAWTLQNALWAGDFGPTSADGVRVAEPVGEIPELNMWLQRRIDAPNGWASLHSVDGSGCAIRIAQALRKLQRSGPRTERLHSLEDEIEILSKQLAEVKEERVDLASAISELEQGCRHVAGLLPSWRPVPTHRDFYPDNILMDEMSVWLVDLDLYCLSHPALDAGNYIGHLWEAAIRRRVYAEVVKDFEDGIIEALSSEMGREVRLEVETFAVLSLARHVAISRRISDRRPFTRDILASARQRLSDLVHRTPVTRGLRLT